MNDLEKDLRETVDYLYDAGRSDLVLSVLASINMLKAAEEMALAVAEDTGLTDFDVWQKVKAYRKAGMNNTQNATPA